MRRTLIVAVVIAGLVAVSGADVAASKSDDAPSSTKGRRIRFRASGPTPTILPPYCDDEQHCVFPGTQTLRLTGDWSGEFIQVSGAVSRADGTRFTSAAINLFVGRVKGCGTGTAVVRLFEAGTLNPATGAGTWEVVRGFGTEGLATLRGSGTGAGGIEDGERVSTQTGRIKCRRS